MFSYTHIKIVLHFYFLVRFYKSWETFDTCIDSILSQKKSNYTIIFIDDNSGLSSSQKKHIQNKLKDHIVLFNSQRKGSLRNAYEAIHTYVEKKDAVIVNVDGDDWLVNPDVITILEKVYTQTKCDLTYGNCVIYDPRSNNHGKVFSELSIFNKRYPDFIESENKYRDNNFRPFHLRTWKAKLFKKIPKEYFLRPDKTWIMICEDQAMFLPMLELAKGNYAVISDVLYSYNASNPLNDKKINLGEKLYDEITIRKKKKLT